MTDISKEPTRSNKIPEIDSLYVYKTKRSGVKFTRHLNKGTGYRYRTHRAIVNAGEDEIYDYHRTVKINGVENGLVLVTKNSKFKEVQKWFNEMIKDIEEDDRIFSKFKAAKSSPQELGLFYLY